MFVTKFITAKGFKASETLLGIETLRLPSMILLGKGFKASETLLGIETKSAEMNIEP